MWQCAALIKEEGKASVLTGDRRMKERPIKDLTDALTAVGCTIEHMESGTSLPIRVHSTGLRGGRIELSGKISSQFVSSVLLSAPYAQAAVEIVLKEKPVSQSYIDMTTKLMGQFGIDVAREGDLVYRVPKGCYKNPKAVQVECDASSATYPLALAAITGGSVTCEAVGSASIQVRSCRLSPPTTPEHAAPACTRCTHAHTHTHTREHTREHTVHAHARVHGTSIRMGACSRKHTRHVTLCV